MDKIKTPHLELVHSVSERQVRLRETEEIAWSLHTKSQQVMTREQLEGALLDHDTQILNADLTRLLVYDINLGHTTPRILGISNTYKPYNPLYVRTVVQEPLSASANTLLRFFNH